ncbi:ATP-grasp fold amidoligase family protein [Photobacterium leiognathi]|uniref:ATP-grasp fold amidoligase family protein n=1 Tax=Photobacterium leiognathi TaxID=553611 RepID=UPI002982898D|nr:ATP-grasp fold amidoligase family protein [Photobacterium leiognathi]
MKKLKYFVRDILRLILKPKGYTFLRFILTHKYIPNFSNPSSFSEKIIFRKFNVKPKVLSKFVDKYTVKEYVKDKIGEKYLIPTLFVTDNIKPKDFSSLPSEFVIKTSNGGGGENVQLVENKSVIDLDKLSEKFNKYLKLKVGNNVDEYFYDIEKPQIIIEKLMRHNDGSFPSDYKIHVFNGYKEDKVIIQIDEDRFGNHKRSLFDIEKNKLDFDIQPKYDSVASNYNWPQNLDEMINVAKALAHDFKYVRVDLYNIDGNIYFGELTFCHGSGWEPFSSKSADFLLGSYWEEFNTGNS